MPSSKDRPICQLIWVKPSIENVIPYIQYKRTQPEYEDDYGIQISQDQVILLGGGRELILGLLNPQGIRKSDGQNQETLEPVELFILNNCIILWFGVLGHGLQIPYTSVLYHAARRINYRNDGHKLEILLTLERDQILNDFFPQPVDPAENHEFYDIEGFTMKSIELTLTPKYSMYDRHYNSEIETLFTFVNFGINRGDDMVNNCNEALSIGMDIHGDDFDVNEDEQDASSNTSTAIFTGLNEILKNHNTFQNSGLADDLDEDNVMYQAINKDPNEAGMSMEF